MKTITALSIGGLLVAGASATAYASPEKQLSGAVDIDCPDKCPAPSDPELVETPAHCSPDYEIAGASACPAPPDGYASIDEDMDEQLASNDGMDCLIDASASELVCSEEQEMCIQEYELASL
jgi:hypothetical protein